MSECEATSPRAPIGVAGDRAEEVGASVAIDVRRVFPGHGVICLFELDPPRRWIQELRVARSSFEVPIPATARILVVVEMVSRPVAVEIRCHRCPPIGPERLTIVQIGGPHLPEVEAGRVLLISECGCWELLHTTGRSGAERDARQKRASRRGTECIRQLVPPDILVSHSRENGSESLRHRPGNAEAVRGAIVVAVGVGELHCPRSSPGRAVPLIGGALPGVGDAHEDRLGI